MSNKRQRVIEEAYRLFYQHGYHGVGINKIVTAADVPKGSFYYYFKTKENLAVETIRYYAQLNAAELTSILTDTSVHPLERLRRLGELRLNKYKNVLKCQLGCYAGNMALEMGDVSEPIRQVLDELFEENCRLIAQCLREIQQAGHLSPALDVDELASFMVNSYQGALVRMKTTNTVEPLQTQMNIMRSFFIV